MAVTAADWDSRIRRVTAKLPRWVASLMHWLLEPAHHWIRIPAWLFFLLGGAFAPIPFVGVWMLPIGFVLLGEDIPWLKVPMERGARWVEQTWFRLI